MLNEILNSQNCLGIAYFLTWKICTKVLKWSCFKDFDWADSRLVVTFIHICLCSSLLQVLHRSVTCWEPLRCLTWWVERQLRLCSDILHLRWSHQPHGSRPDMAASSTSVRLQKSYIHTSKCHVWCLDFIVPAGSVSVFSFLAVWCQNTAKLKAHVHYGKCTFAKM